MDTQFVVRARAGNQDALARLATETLSRLHRVAYDILRDGGLAEDATQQALLSMWQALPTLCDSSPFEAWAYRFVVQTLGPSRLRVAGVALLAKPSIPLSSLPRPWRLPSSRLRPGSGVFVDSDSSRSPR